MEIDYLLQRASLYTSGSVEQDIGSANVIDAHFRVVVFWVGFFFSIPLKSASIKGNQAQ